MRIELIENRHKAIECFLGCGYLDRLSDESYRVAMYGATLEAIQQMQDGELEGIAVEAIASLVDQGLIRHAGYMVSKRNTKRILSNYEAAVSRDVLEARKRELQETLGHEERKKSAFFMMLSFFQEHQRRFEQSE